MKILTALALLVIISVALALPTWALWNALLPFLFGFKAITLIQALGINVLSSLLFKSYTSK